MAKNQLSAKKSMIFKKKLLFIVACAASCSLIFLNGTAMAASCPKRQCNWPSVFKNDWHIRTISKSEITRTAKISSIPSGYYVQGGTVTEKYYVFAVFKSNTSSNNYIYLADRSTGKVIDKYKGNWHHSGSLFYKWGSKQVRVKAGSTSKDGCFDISSGKLKKISIGNCKTKRGANYGAKYLISQGSCEVGNYVYVAGWDAHTGNWGAKQSYTYARHATGIFIYDKSSRKLKKTLYIPNTVIKAEVEDVAIDGNGDMYVFYNNSHNSGEYYRIDKSIVKLTTVTDPNAGAGGNNNSGNSNSGNNNSGHSGNSNSGNNDASSNPNSGSSADIQIAPTHEQQCATILSFWCDTAEEDGAGTIMKIISFVVSVMSIGVAVLGTIGIIMAGVTIMTARDNSAQIQKGKQRIMEVVIGLAIWVLAVAIIALILPDGGSIAEEAINQNTSKEAGV